jgi:hypothetical protein
LKDAIRKRKSSPIHHESQKFAADGKQESDRMKFSDRLLNRIRGNRTPVSKKESLSTLDTAMTLPMRDLELDHFGYLLGKIVRIYQKGDDPHKDVFD